LLIFQHAARMAQSKTREEMGGPFFQDYTTSITNIGGWGDGDSVLTNYVAHPMMGAITGYVQVQNDLGGIYQEFGGSRHYWNSRLRALAFSAAYSTQFEIGPLSEATFGNVGMKKGTAGWVDFIMTPTGGFGLMVAEDALDRHAISKWESGSSGSHKRVLRMLLNPNRSLANLLRMKVPWHRDTRPMFPSADETNRAQGRELQVFVRSAAKDAAARQPSAERKESVIDADGTFRCAHPGLNDTQARKPEAVTSGAN
jgi:hypothetical protein